MKRIIITATITAVMAVAGIPRLAASLSVPVGQTVDCRIVIGPSTIAVSTGQDATDVTATGSATFQSIATGNEPVEFTTLVPIALNFAGSDPTYGKFNFAFDQSKKPTNSSVVANQQTSSFPATGNIYAFAVGTVDGLPGRYENARELHLTSSNLVSFDPQLIEIYTVVDDCVFSDPLNPVAPTFTITAGSQVLLSAPC